MVPLGCYRLVTTSLLLPFPRDNWNVAHAVGRRQTIAAWAVLSGGKRLFADGSAPHSYKLTKSRVSSTGLMIGHYERGGEVTVSDTALAEPSRAEAVRQERMKREG